MSEDWPGPGPEGSWTWRWLWHTAGPAASTSALFQTTEHLSSFHTGLTRWPATGTHTQNYTSYCAKHTRTARNKHTSIPPTILQSVIKRKAVHMAKGVISSGDVGGHVSSLFGPHFRADTECEVQWRTGIFLGCTVVISSTVPVWYLDDTPCATVWGEAQLRVCSTIFCHSICHTGTRVAVISNFF